MYLRTLGGLTLEGTSFSRPKPLLLLAYLALEGPQTRRYLADVFFMDAADPMNSLSRALSYLRQEAPGTIESDPKKAWTNLQCDAVDLLNLSNGQQFENCLELYQGSFAAEYNLKLSEDLSEWLYGTRELLAAKARNAFITLGEQEASKGNFSQAALLAEKAYRLREATELELDDFPRLYTLLYAGNSPMALEVKNEAEGFDIPLTLTREEAKAQFETSDIPQEIPNNLPLAKTTFVGRDQELIEIAQQLAKPECRLLTLHGMGGIGKSRTAIQTAYDQVSVTRGLNPLFADGVYFIALDALTSADMIPSAIAEVLDFEMQGIDDVLTQVQKHIGKKKTLLILDNFEHLMDGAVLPSTLLESCPNLKIIVTSREVLKLEEEWVKNLEGLHYPDNKNLTLEEAQGYEAVQLFIQRAKRAMLEFSMTEDNMSTVIEICQLVEGAPLALELSATWVRAMTLEDIAKEIKSNLDFLERQSRNGNERHQSIRAVFEHSWKLLTAKEQEVFRKLSVFVGSFSREAAAEVAGATLPILASLVNKSLLRVMANGRYSRHFLIYEFSQEKLKETSEELEQTQEKHATFYLDFLSGQSEAILGAGQKEVLEGLDAEVDNIHIAWPKFFVKDYIESHRLAINTFTEYLTIKRRVKEFIDLYLATLETLKYKKEPNLAAAVLSKCIGWLYESLGSFGKAQQFLESSLTRFQVTNHKQEMAWALKILGNIHLAQGNYSQAKSHFSKELEIHREMENNLEITATLNNIGFLNMIEGNYEQAEAEIQESIVIDRKFERLSPLASELDSLGTLYLLTDRPKNAEMAFDESLRIARDIEFFWQIPFSLNGLGKALYMQGNSVVAKQYMLEAMKSAKRSSNDVALVDIYLSLATLNTDLNDFANAEDYLTKALTLAQSHDLKAQIYFCLLGIAKLLIKTESFVIAAQILDYIGGSSKAWQATNDESRKLRSSFVALPISLESQFRRNKSNFIDIIQPFLPNTLSKENIVK